MTSILDERVIGGFGVTEDAKADAIRFGRQFPSLARIQPEEVQCKAFPPDGVKVVLTRGQRRLTIYFLGKSRIVWGKSTTHPHQRHSEGESSLGDPNDDDRLELLEWLSEQSGIEASQS